MNICCAEDGPASTFYSCAPWLVNVTVIVHYIRPSGFSAFNVLPFSITLSPLSPFPVLSIVVIYVYNQSGMMTDRDETQACAEFWLV